jgi:hypothetical protein
VTRSIIGIIPAADIAEDGQPVDPGFTFPSDASHITVVAQAWIFGADARLPR